MAEAVYMIYWTVLTNKTKKGLLLMIARARRPIIITGGSLITMSLDTFVNVSFISIKIDSVLNFAYHLQILRTSYMAFNLLKSF